MRQWKNNVLKLFSVLRLYELRVKVFVFVRSEYNAELLFNNYTRFLCIMRPCTIHIPTLFLDIHTYRGISKQTVPFSSNDT